MSGQNPTYPKSFIYTRDAVQVATESPSKIEVYKDLRDGKLYYLDRNRVPVEINTGGGSGPGANTNIANAELVFDGHHTSSLNSFSWALFDLSTTGTLIAGFIDTLDLAIGSGKSSITIGSGNGWEFDIPVGSGQMSADSMFIGGIPGSYNASGYEFSTQDTAIGKYALANVGTYDYITAGATENNKENTAVGYECLTNFGTSLFITDQEGQNTAVGYRALTSLEGSDGSYFGSFNVALGGRAGEDLTTGDTNIIVGHNAAWEATNAWGNTLIGFEICDGTTSAALDNGYLNIAIGYQVDIDESTNNSTVIGNQSYIMPSSAGGGQMPIYSILIGDNSNALVSTDPAGATTSQDTGIIAIGVGNQFQDIDDGGVVAVGSLMNIVEQAPTGSDGIYTTAVGHKVEIYGWWNDAFGESATIGDGVTASAYNTAIGRSSLIYGDGCSSIGQVTQIGDTGDKCDGSIAIGYGATVNPGIDHAIALGNNSAADKANSIQVAFNGNVDIELVGMSNGGVESSFMQLAGDFNISGINGTTNTLGLEFEVTHFKGQTQITAETGSTFTNASPITLDFDSGDAQEFIIDGAGGVVDANVGATSSFDNLVTGTYIFKITQGAVPATINWGNFNCNIKWPDSYGGSPTLSIVSGDIDMITFYCDSAGDLYGTIANKFV